MRAKNCTCIARGHDAFDFNQPDAYSYEQALQTIRRLRLPMTDVDQQFRRTVFNVIARNHDDHVKNIAYLMNKTGEWRLSPAFDVAYSYNPSGAWTSRHQLSVNGKRDDFIVEDLIALALGRAQTRKGASHHRGDRRLGRQVESIWSRGRRR